MRVLMLTWEYPPFIVGGLGMACYGLFKALAELGVTIKMILPTKDEVFFEISKPEEADYPVAKKDDNNRYQEEPLKFFPYLYVAPEETTYASIGKILSTGPNEEAVKSKVSSEVPHEVVQRLTFILSQGNHLLHKVSLYSNNVLKLAEKINFDLIHAHDWLTYPAGLFLKKKFKKPMVAHLHATEFDRALGYGHPVIHEIEYIGLNYADRAIAVSHYTKSIAIEHYKVSEDRIRVVHNAFTAKTAQPRKIKKFKEPVVLFLGRLTPQKGPKIFLEIAKKVLEQGVRVRFVIAGAGEMERELMLEASSLGIGTYIMFTGFLTREEVEEALSMSDILVMPSVSEPFGIVALEAMHFGCAIIISKQSGASEVIENAYKVDFWDVDKMVASIIELATNQDRLRELQGKVREEVKNFTWRKPAEEIIKIYREILA
ncbi:MAG: glycosyltransferase family 4 protein [Caldimicrobium sp.]|nr:glycosyltransferase family 4 protein [Caldimicrobium sp.]MCX7613160.1 glycosyltransferase family 4 protein [Caldimicrobium sp.]MDW8183233.1 glycosyltransferase family 4 protein [Caldimicrobium sp.]